MKRLITLAIILLTCSVNGQDSLLIGNQTLNKIYDLEGPLFFNAQTARKNFFLNEEGVFKIHSQSILKGKHDLFIRIDGTGRVYRANKKNGDTLFFNRIDSTHFYGYNGHAFEFIYQDTILSLGGEGYWRRNGQLRFFSKRNKEWDIIPLNDEVPILKECVYFDEQNKEIYLLTSPYIDFATRINYKKQFVYKLNLENRKISLLGELHKNQSLLFPTGLQYFSLQLPSLKGELVVFDGNNIFLYDFINNEIYELKNTAIEKTIFASSTGSYLDILFEKNGQLFYSKSNDPEHKIDSISISINDFRKLGSPIYLPKNRYNSLFFLAGILMFVGLGVFIYRKVKSKDKNALNQQQYTISDGSEYHFKPIELDLIDKIYQISLSGKSYSVEDVNNALGLNKKSLEIQKKIRTETLNRINHRFKMKFETDEDLIERIRSEEDRRFYRYIIREENGKKALNS